MPNFLEDYDAIGFDLDLCLIKYNVTNFVQQVVRSVLIELHEKMNYPKEILQFDYHKALNYYINNAVWDVNTGYVLKLGEGQIIMHAVHGYQKVSSEKLIEQYGEPPTFNKMNWPQQTMQLEKEENAYWAMMGLIESAKIPVICHIMQFMINKPPKNKTKLQFAFDLKEVSYRQHEQFIQEHESTALFLRPIVTQGDKFVQQQPDLILKLKLLRRNGKKIFLLTNGHMMYVDLLLTMVFGIDFYQLFDLILVESSKPLFFQTEVNFVANDIDDTEIKTAKEMQTVFPTFKVYRKGNAKMLTEYLQLKCKKKDIKVAYVGSQTKELIEVRKFSDALFGPQWDPICLIEEFS